MNGRTALLVLVFGLCVTAASAQDQKLACGAPPAYSASYSPAKPSAPPSVDVTFRGRKPTSAVAEAALRKCMKEAAAKMFITAEVLGTAWFGKSTNDDEPISLPDGSDHLSYDPKTKVIRTWSERSGVKPTVTTAGAGYFAEYQEQPILVKPGGKFATVNVVFTKQPTEKTAYEAVMAEATQAVQRTHGQISVTAYALVGPKANPAARKQVRGANGKYISADYDPKRPGRLHGAGGEDLGVALVVK